jgi:uncharacterized protein YndB with AHSA1/START domain
MRRILLITSLVIVALIGGLFIWGAILPREHTAGSRVTLATPPESVYAVMRDQAALATWWSEVDTIFPVTGPDARERRGEKMGGAEFTIIVTEEEAPRRFVTVIDTIGGPLFAGRWIHEITPAPGGGSVVTIQEDGWVRNPFFRAMMVLGGGVNHTLDSYLTALGKRLRQDVTPERVVP